MLGTCCIDSQSLGLWRDLNVKIEKFIIREHTLKSSCLLRTRGVSLICTRAEFQIRQRLFYQVEWYSFSFKTSQSTLQWEWELFSFSALQNLSSSLSAEESERERKIISPFSPLLFPLIRISEYRVAYIFPWKE